MTISDFISLVQTEYNSQRGNSRFIDQIEMSKQMFAELAKEIGVVGSGPFYCRGIVISEDPAMILSDMIRVQYEFLHGDYQQFHFNYFRPLLYGNARVAICSAPVFGSHQISGVRNQQYPPTVPSSLVKASLINWSIDDPFVNSISPTPQGCQHEWKHYQGFHLEQYEYCTKCDEKKK